MFRPAPQTDRRAQFEALIRRHQAGVWRYLRSLGATADEADDLLQEALLVTWRRSGFEDRGDAATRAFLCDVAQKLLRRRWRDRGRRAQRLVELADRQWRDAVERGDASGQAWLDALARCLADLQPRARLAIEEWHGGGERDGLAARLELKPNGLKMLLQRTRAALRECIERRAQESDDE